jgi:hypothetical protein
MGDPFGRAIMLPKRVRARPETIAHPRLQRRQTLSYKSPPHITTSPSVETLHYLFCSTSVSFPARQETNVSITRIMLNIDLCQRQTDHLGASLRSQLETCV